MHMPDRIVMHMLSHMIAQDTNQVTAQAKDLLSIFSLDFCSLKDLKTILEQSDV